MAPTRAALQAYFGHRNIQHTVRYTELSPTRFKRLLAGLISDAPLDTSASLAGSGGHHLALRRLRTDPLLLPAATARPPASLSSQQRIFANVSAGQLGDPDIRATVPSPDCCD
jgi:hypothetical protein